MQEATYPGLLASRTGRLPLSSIGSVLRQAASPDMIMLAPGSPAPETHCTAEVTEAAQRVLARADPLQYGDPEGLPALREWIAEDQSRLLARPVDPVMTVLTHGSQQALDLLCKALIDPGDVVVVDRPSYVGALQVFDLFQASVVALPIATDHHLERLEDELNRGLRPKFLYVVPSFANPTGLSLSAAQREKLAGLAVRHHFVVVEDDPYRELYFEDGAERPGAIAAQSDMVVRLGSFSKVLFPAARLGYVIAPLPLAGVLNKLKEAADLGNSAFVERIVYELVSRPGFLARHLAEARALYRERRDALAGALRSSLAGQLRFTVPGGGFFVWGTLAHGMSAAALLTEALAENVSFMPGHLFFASGPDDATLRLAFSSTPPERLSASGPRLAAALGRMP
jgi:2-aminoadipate transaminase